MSSPPAAAAVDEAMAWKPPPSPREEQRVVDRRPASPDDELNRLQGGSVKSPRKPNGSPPRKPGSARPGSSSRRRGVSQRQGQEANPARPQSGTSPRSRALAHAFELKPGLRPYSAGANPNRSSTETYVISASRGSSRAGTPTVTSPQWSKSPTNAAELDAHPPSMPRRHSPPGRMSEGLEAQLDMTARALSAARSQVDEEKRKAITARKAEDTQRTGAAEARADAERAWTTAWQSAEQQRCKREEQLAARMHADRRKLDTRLQQEAVEQAIGAWG